MDRDLEKFNFMNYEVGLADVYRHIYDHSHGSVSVPYCAIKLKMYAEPN